MYSSIKRSGSFGDDFNHDIKLGNCLIPFNNYVSESLIYLPCEVLCIDNTGRYQVIIVKTEDNNIFMCYYNGNERAFKPINELDLEFLEEDAEVDDPEELYEKFISLGGATYTAAILKIIAKHKYREIE